MARQSYYIIYMTTDTDHSIDCLVVGGGLTGLTLAYHLARRGHSTHLLERTTRLGGQIQSHHTEGFVYEQGPSTGIISRPEVAELIEALGLERQLRLALPTARRRLILKGGRFHPLPTGLISALTTPLFSLRDKLGILCEPWRKRGTDPQETIASIARRRLGESYYRYAVDPFVGGIYAGDAERLVVRHALPRLYALEARYGSFVRGAIAKARTPRTERERRATGATFSLEGGLSTLTNALAQQLPPGTAIVGAEITALEPQTEGGWRVEWRSSEGTRVCYARSIATAIPPKALCNLLPEVSPELQASLGSMRYAPVVQVAVGYRHIEGTDFEAFGGLVPRYEDAEVLGILNPSAGFEGRAPIGGMLLSVFLGGMRSPWLIDYSDEEIRSLVAHRLGSWLGIRQTPDLWRIFRHREAIPQYEATTDERLEAIRDLEATYPGLIIGGNMHGGIGMADRIAQATQLADRLEEILRGARVDS